MKIGIDGTAVKSRHHGIGNYFFSMVSALLNLDHKNKYLIWIRSGIKLPWSNSNILHKYVPSSALRIFWFNTFLPMEIYKYQLDIFWGTANALPLIKTTKFIVTIHDLSSFVIKETYPLLRRIYYQKIIENAVKKADIIITDSNFSRSSIINYFSLSSEKVKTIYLGVSPIFFTKPPPEHIYQVRKYYNLPNDYILTLSVLEPKKNIERLIQAYALLKSKYCNFPALVIAGSKKYGWLNRELFTLVYKSNLQNDVFFIDEVNYSDLPVIYHCAMLFVFPSLYEGFGLPVLEAMACGIPVITSNTSALSEISNNCAVLIDPYNVYSIAQAIETVIFDTEKRKVLGAKGQKNAERFSWDTAAKNLLEIFYTLEETDENRN
ncbi:MAG: glycosyltransferase family 4 protein [candidate division WOR-3 bacterium]|nr:glycosyltransferase family 4 protein [candidate division WOR-3 bacterium]MCX7757801.1 glycosyltransferase family 4 protein [candidate division WOR-3 bacterium]MDW7987198.1 glycosyltransferase family 1 protein [candidate division WOR-3 bacterium]